MRLFFFFCVNYSFALNQHDRQKDWFKIFDCLYHFDFPFANEINIVHKIVHYFLSLSFSCVLNQV